MEAAGTSTPTKRSSAGGIGAYEVAGFTNALTDMEYLDLVQPYLDKAEIGMFLNAKRFREPTVELAASKGMKFLRCGADAGDARKISEEPVKAIKKCGFRRNDDAGRCKESDRVLQERS